MVGREQILLPTCPRISRGPHVDPDTIPTTGPFVVRVANLPFDMDDMDLSTFFKDLEVS